VGAGFVLALSKRYPELEAAYRQWYNSGINHLLFLDEQRREPFEMGYTQFVPVAFDFSTSSGSTATSSRLWVANMLAQHGVASGFKRSGSNRQPPPIRYPKLQQCLAQVAEFAQVLSATARGSVSVQMPRIGAGLAGGDWNIIASIIEQELVGRGIAVTVLDLK
jgi:hypothetical protein